MSASFTVSRDDHLRFHRISEANVVRTAGLAVHVIALKVLAWVFYGLAMFALVDLGKSDTGAMFRLMPFVFYLATGLLIHFGGNAYLRKRYLNGLLAEDGWYLGEQTLAATQGGFVLTTRFGTVALNWSGIRGVVKDDRNYYVLIEPGQGFIIPQEAAATAALQPLFETRVEPEKNWRG